MSQENGHTARELIERLMFGEANGKMTRDLLKYLWDRMDEEISGKKTEGIVWINAKDKSPDEAGIYLICYENGDVTVGNWYREKDFFAGDKKIEGEWKWHDPLDCNYDIEGVAYWAEFPDPPKKGV